MAERCSACRLWRRLRTGETNFGHCCAIKGRPWPYWKAAPDQYVVTHASHGRGCARFHHVADHLVTLHDELMRP